MKITSYKVQMTLSIVAFLSGIALCVLLLLGLGPTKRDPQLWVSAIAIILVSIVGMVRAVQTRKSE